MVGPEEPGLRVKPALTYTFYPDAAFVSWRA